jgi:hypothetical protein
MHASDLACGLVKQPAQPSSSDLACSELHILTAGVAAYQHAISQQYIEQRQFKSSFQFNRKNLKHEIQCFCYMFQQ